ncbi:MAG: COG1361 S-layer family protein [Anaerotignaceae bacterium]
MKKKLKALIMILLMVQMVFGSALAAYGADDDDDTDIAGAPQVLVVNGPIFDVTAGEENEVTISVKNLSSYIAKSVIVMPQIAVVDGNPLDISIKGTSNNLSAISPNAGKNLTFLVGVDKAASAKTYAVDVRFNFYNTDGVNYETKSTIYFKVKGVTTENNIFFEGFTVEPDTLEVGGTGKIGVTIKNRGPLSMYGVEISLDGLDPTLISAKGVSSKKIANIMAGTKESFTFDIASNSSMTSGNYPVTFKVTCKDENGTAYTYEQKYYVVVGGSSSGKKSELAIKNLVEPSGVYGVNQNFEIKFDVANNGTAEATNVKVTASEYGEGANIVPKTSSVISVEKLAAGASKPMSFTFAATGSASTRNYTVELKVEYEQNGKAVSFSQYAGANVSNPENDKDEDKTESKPKIIVSEYTSDPIIVMAGEEFDLTMTFLNTHAQKAVKNVKMYLTMAEETSAESTKTGNIFTPVDSSNTFYFDSIPAKGTVEKKLRLYVVPDAQPKTYTITVNFEYEDESAKEYTSTELLGVNVKQSTKVETSEIVIPETSEVYMPISVYFDIFNTGKVALSNLKVTLEGDIDTTSKSTYIGNCASGESGYYEGNFSVINEGENNVKLTISYDDASGEKVEEVHEYTIIGSAPMPMEEGMEGEMDEDASTQGGTLGAGKIIAIVCGVIFIIVIAVVVLKKKKAKKEAKFIEADLDDDTDNILEVIEEGKDHNEQL